MFSSPAARSFPFFLCIPLSYASDFSVPLPFLRFSVPLQFLFSARQQFSSLFGRWGFPKLYFLYIFCLDFLAVWREDFLGKIGKLWREDEQRGVDLMAKFKREHIVLTKEETEAFRIKLEPVIDKWVEDVKKEGIDGRKLVNKARKLIKKYEE